MAIHCVIQLILTILAIIGTTILVKIIVNLINICVKAVSNVTNNMMHWFLSDPDHFNSPRGRCIGLGEGTVDGRRQRLGRTGRALHIRQQHGEGRMSLLDRRRGVRVGAGGGVETRHRAVQSRLPVGDIAFGLGFQSGEFPVGG